MPRATDALTILRGDPATSYERDLHAWATQQARLLREGRLDLADIPNIAEEMEDLGRLQRGQLRSRTATLVEHLLKLETSTAAEPRRGWQETVRRTRSEIGFLLADNPSLRRQLPAILREVHGDTVRLTADLLEDAGEGAAASFLRRRAADLTPEQVFGSWIPGFPEG